MTGALARRVAFAAAVLVLLAIAVRVAWIGDDAYITLRTIENCARGDGLRWNVADRALTNTHPLWMLALLGVRAVAGEVYFATIAFSLALAAVAIVLLLRRASTTPALVATAGLLATARAFPEYCTSGLEPPLAFLLLAVWVGVATQPREPAGRLFATTLLAALLVLTRMDFAVLAAPVALAALRGIPPRRAVAIVAVASTPLLVWLLAATLYYGSPLPVTANAKAFGLGIPAADLAAQGLWFVRFTAGDDPVLVGATVAGLAVGLWSRPTRMLALGGALYLGYVVKVGGDFMAGRFFLPPFVLAVAILAERLSRARAGAAWLVAVAALAAMFVRGVPAWLRAPASDTRLDDATIEANRGIVDERRMHYAHLGLLSPTRELPVYGTLQELVWPQPQERDRPWILLNGSVGVVGFRMGRLGHVLDPILCDPLLTRLPAKNPKRWRIGHVMRRIPEGYYETLASGTNRLHHPGLAAFHDQLELLTRAPLWSGERFGAIARLTFGVHAGLRAFVDEHYYTPPRLDVAAGELPPPLPLGTFWFDEPRLRLVYDGGLAIRWPAARTASAVRVQTIGLCDFRLRFVRGGEVVADVQQPPPPPANPTLRAVAGLREETFAVPPATGAFDTLWIDVVDNVLTHTSPGPPAVGALVLTP
jgi:arabinofuranosyltransferase